MRSGTKYTLAAGAAVGLLVLMDLLLLRGAPPPRPEVKLPDGRVFQLLGITEGKSHSLNKLGPRSFLVRFLPAPLRKMAGPQFSSSFGFGRPGLALWLMCYDPATDSFQSGWSCKLIDEHGCEFPPQGMGSTSDGYYQAHIINFPAYPRHTNSLICRLFDSNGKQLADFPIEHVPSAPPHANWIPDPLPAWKTNGPLALRLDGFDQITQPRFQVFCEGQAQVHWTAESILLEDASGNTGEILCRKLPTWKWRATFHRTADAPFAPEEIVTFTNISLPAPRGAALDAGRCGRCRNQNGQPNPGRSWPL